ncbi:MAG TPA: hypothetical protein VNN21_05245 [Dehalococcoidia bacterium]|nr:hypothetical protein [Dehalococcoidia bacterium]
MSSRAAVAALPLNRPARILIQVRRVEAIALLIAAAYVVAAPHMHAVFALPFLAIAVLLHPRPRTLANARAAQRARLIDFLDAEARHLRQRYMEIRALPLSLSRTQAQWQIRREIAAWIVRAETRFRVFPEFQPIFAEHRRQGGIIDELDSCLQRLRELKRLVELSRELRLPI